VSSVASLSVMRKVHGDRAVLCEIEDREAFGLTGGDTRPTRR
jgi:hypothetical protein